MRSYSNIIDQVKQKYFELHAKNQQSSRAVLVLEEEIQTQKKVLEQLKSENKSLEEQLQLCKTELQTTQKNFQEELETWKIQLEEKNNNAEQLDVSEIVREIDDCIILIKNNL